MAKPQLDKKVIGAFRDFAATGALQTGLDYLRREHAPDIAASSPENMLHDSLVLKGYMSALKDVENQLTALPAKDVEDKLDSLIL